jgi:tRNA (guanine37-N1)-methyltransferase
MLRIDVVTIFPELFPNYLTTSIPGIAARKGKVQYRLHHLRDYTTDVHRTVDDRPFGGGPGMILKVEPVAKCVRAILAGAPGQPVGNEAHEGDAAAEAPVDPPADAPVEVVITSPAGQRFEQGLARAWSGLGRLVVIAGHYEGHDDRIETILGAKPVSIGDFVLTGGELPALCMIDAVVRLLPGTLGDATGVDEESFEFWARGADGKDAKNSAARERLLEYPQYTRPAEFEGVSVPDVLLSGHHAEVGRWRTAAARQRTRDRRPDLLPPSSNQA